MSSQLSSSEVREADLSLCLSSDELEQKIIEQVEYYFGDYNLSRDKFLLNKIVIEDGWVPMSIMMNFPRLRKLTTNPEIIMNALRKSNLMEVSENRIRRSPLIPFEPFTEEKRQAFRDKAVYIKGFSKDMTFDDVKKLMKDFSLENIVMRQSIDRATKTRKFSGSIFAVFSTKEKAERFINLKSFEVNGTETTRKFQSDYFNEKKQEALEMKLLKLPPVNEKMNIDSTVFKRGTVLRLCGNFCNVKKKMIKKCLKKLNIVPAYVEIMRNRLKAYIRLKVENSAGLVFDKLKDGFNIGQATIQAMMLTGKQERKYLKRASKKRKNKKLSKFKRRVKQIHARARNEQNLPYVQNFENPQIIQTHHLITFTWYTMI